MSRPRTSDSDDPEPDADRGQLPGLPDREPEHVAARGAERHAHADLVRALRDHVRHDAIDADHRQQQREAAEDEHDRADVLQADRPLVQRLAHRLELEDGLRRIHAPARRHERRRRASTDRATCGR